MLPRRHGYAPASLFVISLVLLAFLPAVPASVGVPFAAGSHDSHGSPRITRTSSEGYRRAAHDGAFPFLTWIRDTAVELIFGRPAAASKSSTATPVQGVGALNPRYAKETVIRFNVSTPEHEGAIADAADRLFLDVWAFTQNFVDIRLHKNDVAPLLSLLPESLQSEFSTLIPDLPAAVWATYPTTSLPRSKFEAGGSQLQSGRRLGPSVLRQTDEFDNVFFHDFQPLAVIYRWMRLLESMFPEIVEVETIGTSFEGREILGLRVGKQPEDDDNDDERPKKTIVVNGGLHAREWIAASTVSYLAWSLISSYGREPVITRLLDNFTTVFIPVLNPDGYEYTWNGDRLWRKSRQDTPVNFCRGFDLDHAFGFEWDKNLPEPCSESYGGEQPFQAVEAQQLSAWARSQSEEYGAKFVGFIDLHSYSQEILYPYAYSCDSEPPNVENLQELGAGIAKAIRLSSGESYDLLPACEGAVSLSADAGGGRRAHRIESGGGSAIDWFYHEMHAKYSYQIKLRDRGSYGFLLPREEIIPTGEEVLNALKYYADFLLGNNGIEKSIPKPSSPSASPHSRLPADDNVADVDESRETEWTELKRRRTR